MVISSLHNVLRELLNSDPSGDYRISKHNSKRIILRHDIDSSLVGAFYFSEHLNQMDIRSNFYVRLNSNMYNVLSKQSSNIIQKIASRHNLGLHIESPSNFDSYLRFFQEFNQQRNILENIIGGEINSVSWHRPDSRDLGVDFEGLNVILLYSKKFFSKYHYVSDSANSWNREKSLIVRKVLRNKAELQLLLHPEWWLEKNTFQEPFFRAIALQIEIMENELNAENKYLGDTFKFTNIELNSLS